MRKKSNRWKHSGVFVLMILFVLTVSIVFMERDIKEEKKENADLQFQIQNLECGKSFTVTENTHYSVIKRTEKLLKHSNADKDSVTIGGSNYKFMGASYSWDGKFVWEVQKSDSSYFEISIENKDLRLNIAKCMTISRICQ